MRRVVKVGGSLLLRDDLLESLPRWIDSQTESETLVIVGGGELIDAIRHLDDVRGGDSVETHWLCVDLLDKTFEVFSRWFDWPSIRSSDALHLAMKNGFSVHQPTVVAVNSFYHRAEPKATADNVPLDWRTTTDTIAALLAICVGAEELVLLKSCDVDSSLSVTELAQRGILDGAFPHLHSELESKVGSIRIEKLPS